MKREFWVIQKQVKRGSSLNWECVFSSYNYSEVVSCAIEKDTQKGNYRIKRFIEGGQE